MTDIHEIVEYIIQHELHFHFSKSGGHGGQNINKRQTKAELYFNIHDSNYLTSEQKQHIIEHAGHMIHHHEWILIMTCQEERFQHANKEKVIHHFRQLLSESLEVHARRWH